MNSYYELLQYPVFSIKNMSSLYTNEKAARNALEKLLRDGLVVKIRNGMYTCISGENGGPVANRFQIASAINPSSYVSHHTAFEYYGITDQVFYDVYVSSDQRFHDFSFDGYTYHFMKSQMQAGVNSPEFSGGIRVTDKERTVVDSIRDLNRVAGLEEVVSCISSLRFLDEIKLLTYLDKLDNPFACQKVGFILSIFQDKLKISDAFLAACKTRIGTSTRYLTDDHFEMSYSGTWKLIYPCDIKNLKNGGDEHALI